MILFLALCTLMLLVVAYDATRYIIPNWLNGMVLLLYPLQVLTLSPTPDWPMALLAAGMVLVLGIGLYAMKWMGAGDVKLLAALTPWLGFTPLLVEYLLLVALMGGALSLLLVGLRKLLPWVMRVPTHPYARLLHEGAPVPYGLAIAGVFLGFLCVGKLPGL